MARRANSTGVDGTAELEDPDLSKQIHESMRSGTSPSSLVTPTTALRGGSAGVLENSLMEVGGAKVHASASQATDGERPPHPPTKKYEVFGTGINGKFILLNGYKVLMRDGRLVDEAYDDIEMMTKQGISLRPIPESAKT